MTTDIQGNRLKQVCECKYLCSIFTRDGKMERQIDARLQKANHMLYQLARLPEHRTIDIKTKRQLISAIFVPTLCYQCQTWTINKRNERLLTSCEIKCLRKAADKFRRDRIRNEKIRRIMGVNLVMHHIDKQRVICFAHLMGMPPNQPARIQHAWERYKVKGAATEKLVR